MLRGPITPGGKVAPKITVCMQLPRLFELGVMA